MVEYLLPVARSQQQVPEVRTAREPQDQTTRYNFLKVTESYTCVHDSFES